MTTLSIQQVEDKYLEACHIYDTLPDGQPKEVYTQADNAVSYWYNELRKLGSDIVSDNADLDDYVTEAQQNRIIEQAKAICKERQQVKRDTTPLDNMTTEYLDSISKALQRDTFAETQPSYHDRWMDVTMQVELAALMTPHDDGNDITLLQKLCDSRIRGIEGILKGIRSYGQRLTDQIDSHVVTDPEITPLELERLTERRNRLRDQYQHVSNLHYVWLKMIRPEIERRTGHTMDAYRSAESLEAERHTKQWRPKKKPISQQEWDKLTDQQKRQCLKTHFVKLQG